MDVRKAASVVGKEASVIVQPYLGCVNVVHNEIDCKVAGLTKEQACENCRTKWY